MSEPAPLILHVIFRLDYGGLENGLVNLLNRMPPDKFRHAIVCLAGYSEFRSRIQRDDVAVYSLDKRPGKDLGVYVRFWKVLRKLRPDVVHTRNLGAVDMQLVAWMAGVRGRVHGEHGWDAADPLGTNPRLLMIRRFCRRAIHRYVAMSRDLARWLESAVGVAPTRVAQIYNGVDLRRFSMDGAVASDVPWDIAGDRLFVFGTVGRIDPIKNQRFLIDAFARLAKERKEAGEHLRLIVAGGGPLLKALQDHVAELNIADRVWFPGARNDIPDVLRAMNVFVLPSINEGISNTLLEAMAASKPVIASRVGGNPELVEDGRTGRLYESQNETELLAAMRSYCDAPQLALAHGAEGRDRVERHFGMDAMVRGYVALYEQVSA